MNQEQTPGAPAGRGQERINPLPALFEANKGCLTVEKFMREALYHPSNGYYSSHALTVGNGGDFSTSATLDPIMGEAIGMWLTSQRSLLRNRRNWHVIELGAGSGTLAQSVLQTIGLWKRQSLRYHIVETSARLTQTQNKLLSGFRVDWHTDIREALRAANGEALIFSNEFVDAFPCRVLQMHEQTWHEVCLVSQNDQIQERLMPLLEPIDLDIGKLLNPSFPDGQRVELHQAYKQWLHSWRPLFKRGAILTIDYGEISDHLYYRRPKGTMRAFFKHQRYQGDEVYLRFGKQDITADVNFSHLKKWGEELGLETVGFSTQREFLLRFCPHAQQEAARTPAIAYLLNPDGPGEAFKVLIQYISHSA